MNQYNHWRIEPAKFDHLPQIAALAKRVKKTGQS